MHQKAENAALPERRFPERDFAGGEINRENTTPQLQVKTLVRRCAVSAAMARALAPLAFEQGSPR